MAAHNIIVQRMAVRMANQCVLFVRRQRNAADIGSSASREMLSDMPFCLGTACGFRRRSECRICRRPLRTRQRRRPYRAVGSRPLPQRTCMNRQRAVSAHLQSTDFKLIWAL
jgi:hypothetical protein